MALLRVDDDFDLDRVGHWSPDEVSDVRAESIVAYSSAVGESDPRMLTGDLAPLLFGVVPSWDLASRVAKDAVPESARPRLVHGEHLIRSRRPLRAGDRLVSRARLRAIRPVSTGTLVVVDIESTDPAGNLLVQQVSTAFVIGVVAAGSAGEVPERPAAMSGPSQVVALPTDAGLPARYAEASGDRSPIHLDGAAARAIGLPGVILHGMCTLAIAARAVVQAAAADPADLRSIACRFSAVAIPGDDLITTITGDGPARGFEVADPDGRAILTVGRAELAPAEEESA